MKIAAQKGIASIVVVLFLALLIIVPAYVYSKNRSKNSNAYATLETTPSTETTPSSETTPSTQLGLTASTQNIRTVIKPGEKKDIFTLSEASGKLNSFGYNKFLTQYGPKLAFNPWSGGLQPNQKFLTKLEAAADMPEGLYTGTVNLISYTNPGSFPINYEIAVRKDIGLTVDVPSISTVIPQGGRKHQFNITSTGSQGFALYGYPTTLLNLGPVWTVASGGISVSSTVPVGIQVNKSVATGDYSGTGKVITQNYNPPGEFTFPVTVKVVENACLYDVNRDTKVNSIDLSQVSQHYGLAMPSGSSVYDVNSDGNVNSIDLGLTSQNFGKNCPSASLLK